MSGKQHFDLERFDQTTGLFQRQRTSYIYEIWWLKQGEGSLIVDRQRLSLQNNAVYCFPPNHPVSCLDLQAAEGWAVSLSADVFLGSCNYSSDSVWANSFVIDMCFQVICGVDDIGGELDVIFFYLQRELHRQEKTKSEVIAGLLNLLAIYLSRKMQEAGETYSPSREYTLFQRFRTLIGHHYIQKKFVSDYADELRITPTHLNRVVKKLTGKTASSVIHEHILREAKRLALESDLSMKETAYTLGFADHYHFSRFFRTHSGVCFSEFKNNAGPKESSITIFS